MAVQFGLNVGAYVDPEAHLMLSAAAWADLSERMQELLAKGRRGTALQLWESVREAVHVRSPTDGAL